MIILDCCDYCGECSVTSYCFCNLVGYNWQWIHFHEHWGFLLYCHICLQLVGMTCNLHTDSTYQKYILYHTGRHSGLTPISAFLPQLRGNGSRILQSSLWSVYSLRLLRYRYWWKHLTAKLIADASCLIWAYLCSAGVNSWMYKLPAVLIHLT